MSTLSYPHIEFSSKGIPVLSGTNTKVIEIVLDRLAYNWDADEIKKQHPHLTLSKIFAALTYYYDNQEEIDKVITTQLNNIEKLKSKTMEPSLRLKLKSKGFL